MMDKIEGYLEVGRNEQGEVVINHPDPEAGRERRRTHRLLRGEVTGDD